MSLQLAAGKMDYHRAGVARYLGVTTSSVNRLALSDEIPYLKKYLKMLQNQRPILVCAHEYRKLMDQFKMRPSMSRKGDCYDNAPMESFWGTLKNELIHHCRYKTREQAIREITEYIEVFYNRQRRQARLGYLSPANYERQFYARQVAA
jgi:transposase InsO family protein